jgi:molybdopterin synthase sulfur carrier subunit
MATVIIPASMRKLTGGVDRTTAAGSTVGQLIEDLEHRFPGLRNHLIEDGDLKASIAVSIDGEFGTNGVRERVRDDSEVHFVPALSGGAP